LAAVGQSRGDTRKFSGNAVLFRSHVGIGIDCFPPTAIFAYAINPKIHTSQINICIMTERVGTNLWKQSIVSIAVFMRMPLDKQKREFNKSKYTSKTDKDRHRQMISALMDNQNF
jgi:hypothetical protein